MLHNFVLPIDLYVQSKSIKGLLNNRGWASLWAGFPRVSSLLYFQAEFPSGAWGLAMSTYLPRLLSPVREGAQGGPPSAIQTSASGLT